MATQPTLAEQMVALCEQHDLTSLSVDITRREDGSFFFGSYAHSQDVCASASLCRETPHSAVAEALTALKAKLGEALIDVPEMESAS